MKSIHQTFTVHPVGQGLFYSGHIELKADSREEIFRFIYDCGSLTASVGEDEVDRYRREYFPLETDRLGLLVISHFDADHVNHIKRLLAATRKVDKIVMPFTEFEERLFLVLRFLENKNGGATDEDLGTVRIMLNPLKELSLHFDDDGGTTVFLVTSDPVAPVDREEGSESNGDGFMPEDSTLEFGFEGQDTDLGTDESIAFFLSDLTLDHNNIIRSVKDSITGDLHFKNDPITQLMEFVFYRRGATGDQKSFYKAVFEAFCDRYNVQRKDPLFFEKIVAALKNISGATEIRKLYSVAKKTNPAVKIIDRDIMNMNTTALCMLHRNLGAIERIFRKEYSWAYDRWGPFVLRIEKPFGRNVISYQREVLRHYPWNYSHILFDESRRSIFEECYPNAILTSDSFLQKQDESDEFWKRYAMYHRKYWLFQIPHHGSKHNINRYLLAQLKTHVAVFMNFGIRHQFEKKFSHPHQETIQELIATGQFINVHAVNEFTGLCFHYFLSD